MIDQYNVNVLQKALEGLGLKPVSVSENGFYTSAGSVNFDDPNTWVTFLERLSEDTVAQETYIGELEDDIVRLGDEKQTLKHTVDYIRILLKTMREDVADYIDSIIDELEGEKTDEDMQND